MWWTKILSPKPVMVRTNSNSSVTVLCSLTSTSNKLSSIFFPSLHAPLSLSGWFSAPALGRVGYQLVRSDTPEGHPTDPTMQRFHLACLFGSGLEGGIPLVAGYGSGHYGRFLKDLGRAPRCRLILCAPHVPAAPLVGVRFTPLLWRRQGGGASTKGMIPSQPIDLFRRHIDAARK